MISRKFVYADDLALLHSSGNWKDLEGTLSQDMSTLSAYLHTWRLKLSHTKTVTTAFHLNNREAKRELKVYNLSSAPDLASAPLNGQITNGKRSTVKVFPGSMLLCPRLVPGLLGWAYPEQLGLSSTACGLVLGDSIRPCTNGVSLLHRIVSVVPLSKPQTMY